MLEVKAYLKKRAILITAGIMFLQQSFTFASPVELSLADSIHLALTNNPAIQIASTDREKAEWSVNEANASRIPSVSLGSSYSMNGSSGVISNEGKLNNSLRLNWQVYTGGRVQNQIKQAEIGLSSADLNLEKTKQQLRMDVTSGYYTVLQTRSMASVNQETVNNLREHLNVVQAKYEAGVVAKSDVLRAEVELANAEQNLLKSQNQYDLAVSNLNNMMNMTAGTDIVLKDELQYVFDARTMEECMKLAKNNRPDIAQADMNVDMADSSVKIAESSKYPSVSLSASTGWNDNIMPSNGNWSVGLSASWNVFDAGVTNAKIKQAGASLDKAKLQAEQTRDSVEQEVRQSYLSMKEAEKRLETTNMAVGKAEEDLYIAKEKYTAGVGTNLDVIDSQLALTQAKTNYIQALYDFNINKAKLDKAVGSKIEG